MRRNCGLFVGEYSGEWDLWSVRHIEVKIDSS